MGFLDDLKKWARPYSDEDEEYYDDYEDEAEAGDLNMDMDEEEPVSRSPRRSPRRSTRRSSEAVTSDFATSAFSPAATDARQSGNSRIVNINATTQLQVILVRPESYESASEIATQLRERKAVLLNLEGTDQKLSRRMVDFLSGCAYALDGKLKKVAAAAYLITPYNVEIVGDLMSELENNKDMYF